MSKRAGHPNTIDEYLARLSVDKREALERLRQTIHAVIPRAEECISYQMPAFRLNGRVLVWMVVARAQGVLHALADHRDRTARSDRPASASLSAPRDDEAAGEQSRARLGYFLAEAAISAASTSVRFDRRVLHRWRSDDRV